MSDENVMGFRLHSLIFSAPVVRKTEKKQTKVIPGGGCNQVLHAFVSSQDLVEKSASKRAAHANPPGTASIHSSEIKSWHSKHCNGNNIVSHTAGRKT